MSVILLSISTALLGGGIPVVLKLSIGSISPFVFTSLRFGIALIVLIPFAWRQLSVLKNLSRATLLRFCLSIIANMGNIYLFLFGISSSSATIAQILYLGGPVIVAYVSTKFLHERIGVYAPLGICLGISGAFLAILSNLQIEGSAFGAMMISLAVLSHAAYVLLSRPLSKQIPSLARTTCMSLACFLVSIVMAFAMEPVGPQVSTILADPIKIAAVTYVGIVGGALYYFVQQYVIHHHSAVASSAILYIQPIGTALWATWLLNENITLSIIGSGILALSGAYLVTR